MNLSLECLLSPARMHCSESKMGGHVAAAAIEQETLATARNKIRYHGAVPICGVVGDTALFDYLNAYQFVAQYLGGLPATSFPTTDFAAIQDKVKDALWLPCTPLSLRGPAACYPNPRSALAMALPCRVVAPRPFRLKWL